MVQQGKIYKIKADQYDVFCDDGTRIRAKACGRFRKDGQTPKVGDECLVEARHGSAVITQLLVRKNELLRPPVANIDRLLVVLTPCYPQPDLLLADLLICYARSMGIQVTLCVNKTDLNGARAEQIAAQYAHLPELSVRLISSKTQTGIDELRQELAGQISCVAGQSAVGKSSLIRLLARQQDIATGELSAKTERGRHTTRHSELIPLEEGGFIADTPGFSMLQKMELSPEEFRALYYEYEPYEGFCRFRGCSHTGEPDCAVRAAVERGELSAGRYERYGKLFRESLENWRNRYD